MKNLIFFIGLLMAFNANAQGKSSYNHHSAEAAYWNAFNGETIRIKKGAKALSTLSDWTIKAGTLPLGKKGYVIRKANNNIRTFIRNNPYLPPAYQPN